MSEPCHQEPTIKKLDSKVDRILESLLILSEQKIEIAHLVKTQGDHREWLKGHEGRIQALEKQPGKIATGALVLLATAAASTVSGVIVYAVTRG